MKLIGGDIDGALADWDKAIGIDKPQAERVLGMREAGSAMPRSNNCPMQPAKS